MSSVAAADRGARAARQPVRDRLLAAASDLFYAEGTQSVGIDRIIERAGVAKASLYHHFSGKEALVEAYLRRRHEGILGRLRSAAQAAEGPRAAILAVFDSQAESWRRPGYNGCAFVAASTEAPAGGLVEQATAAHRAAVLELLRDLAAQAGAADPGELARQLQLLHDGAAVAARLDRDPASVSAATRAAVTAVVDRHLDGPAPEPV